MLDLQGLHIRAALFRLVREFFAAQGFLEVDTPIRQPVIIPECNIVPVTADGCFLQTSPELCMKRLLASGCNRIFQICPCFRKNELGRRHLEEFTMLEWYRSGEDYHQLMRDCEAMLKYVVTGIQAYLPVESTASASREKSRTFLVGAADKLTVAEAFSLFSPIPLEQALRENLFDELLVEHIEPNLGLERPLFLMDYPKELASLATVNKDNPAIAERFELYAAGIELANGFSELTDPAEQRIRFDMEITEIERQQGRTQKMPERFLKDLAHLEKAAGIAFGLDRLLMLILGKRCIGDVVTFAPDDFE